MLTEWSFWSILAAREKLGQLIDTLKAVGGGGAETCNVEPGQAFIGVAPAKFNSANLPSIRKTAFLLRHQVTARVWHNSYWLHLPFHVNSIMTEFGSSNRSQVMSHRQAVVSYPWLERIKMLGLAKSILNSLFLTTNFCQLKNQTRSNGSSSQ